MTVKLLARVIGAELLVSTDVVPVRVRIEDVRHNFGKIQLYVASLSSDGEAWIDLARVVRVLTVPHNGREALEAAISGKESPR